jgi:hypothetical protein
MVSSNSELHMLTRGLGLQIWIYNYYDSIMIFNHFFYCLRMYGKWVYRRRQNTKKPCQLCSSVFTLSLSVEDCTVKQFQVKLERRWFPFFQGYDDSIKANLFDEMYMVFYRKKYINNVIDRSLGVAVQCESLNEIENPLRI